MDACVEQEDVWKRACIASNPVSNLKLLVSWALCEISSLREKRFTPYVVNQTRYLSWPSNA